MARPSLLTQARHERIVEQLRDGVPFATACRAVGVSVSDGYDWLYRGWGSHPDRPPAARYVAFARAVDAVFPGGFTERHEDDAESPNTGFVDAQRSGGAESDRRPFAEPQSRSETGEAAGFSESGAR